MSSSPVERAINRDAGVAYAYVNSKTEDDEVVKVIVCFVGPTSIQTLLHISCRKVYYPDSDGDYQKSKRR